MKGRWPTTSISARLRSSASRLPGAAASTVTKIAFMPSSSIMPSSFSVFGRFRSTYSCIKNVWEGSARELTISASGADALVDTWAYQWYYRVRISITSRADWIFNPL